MVEAARFGRIFGFDVTPSWFPQRHRRIRGANKMSLSQRPALAVTTVGMRPEFLRLLARSPDALAPAAEYLVTLGPWTPGGGDWNGRVLESAVFAWPITPADSSSAP